jgi:hypothetical protein
MIPHLLLLLHQLLLGGVRVEVRDMFATESLMMKVVVVVVVVVTVMVVVVITVALLADLANVWVVVGLVTTIVQ